MGATYPEMSKILRKLMPKTYFLVPGYGAQGGTAKDLMHCFNEDGLGAVETPPEESSLRISRRNTQSSVRNISQRHPDRPLWI